MKGNKIAHPHLQADGWAKGTNRGDRSTQKDYTMTEPVALAVFKRGRWCVVAKLTFLNRERVLAVAHREQKGVVSTISIPVLVLEYARLQGATTLCFRRDKTGQMWRLPLPEVTKKGWLGPGAGAEWYIDIDQMERVPWCAWEYASRVVNLEDSTLDQKRKESSHQLPLMEVVL